MFKLFAVVCFLFSEGDTCQYYEFDDFSEVPIAECKAAAKMKGEQLLELFHEQGVPVRIGTGCLPIDKGETT